MGMEHILYDRLQHDKQNMLDGELRERCPHDTCDIHKIQVVSPLRNPCARWLSHFLQSPQVYWSVVYSVLDILFLLHSGHLLQNVGVHFAHNHVASSSTF